VGVVWSGKPTHHNDHNRSIPVEQFLRALPAQAEVFSLHDRIRDQDAAVLAAHPRIRRFDGQIQDFADTAALAAAMDLVVSVDTSAAHLAAALGQPTWVLLPFAPDWRWLLDREDSPWYPTVRLFRQPALGDWDSVLARVRTELERLVSGP
jgi:ADP-heptose:LPS heptosyltransferase